MDILFIVLCCFIFSTIIIGIVYLLAFHKAFEQKYTFPFDGIKSEPFFDRGKTNIVLFSSSSLNQQWTIPKMQKKRIVAWLGLILLFSVVIVLGVQMGTMLFKIYCWII